MTPAAAVRGAAQGGGLRAFRHRNYRLFFVGQLISLVGTWMQQVAQGWLVLELTHDPLMLGLVATAQFAPVIVFGLFGGVIADQLPKRKTLLVTQTVAMILAFALWGLTASGSVQVWQIMILAALLGTVNAFDMPARQSFAIEMVGREDVVNAVGLGAAMFNGARVVGPAVAGLTIGAFGIALAFLINGISFLAVIAAYLAMRPGELRPPPVVERPRSVRAVVDNLAEGLSYVWRTPIVLLAVSVVGLVATVGMNFQVLMPPLAQDILGVGATGYGFLMAAMGVGSTIAALWVAFSRRVTPRPIAIGSIALGLTLVAIAASRSFPLSLGLMVVAGAGAIGMAATANTTIQLTVPDHLRGRVMSVYTTVFAGSVPVGGLMAGAIASIWDVPLSLAVGGVLSLAVGVWAWFGLARIRSPSPDRVSAGASVGAAETSAITSARPR
jgi:MFS family permease